jgi:hypothetical protein
MNLAGLLTCTSNELEHLPTSFARSGLNLSCSVLDAYSYGVVTDSHRLPEHQMVRTIGFDPIEVKPRFSTALVSEAVRPENPFKANPNRVEHRVMLITADLLRKSQTFPGDEVFSFCKLGSPFPGPVDALLPAPTLIAESGRQEPGMGAAS